MKNRKEKDRIRKLKRVVKRSGNKKVRSAIKRDLMTNPEEAHLTQVDYDGRTSKTFNGNDYDSTRQKKPRHQPYQDDKADGDEDLGEDDSLGDGDNLIV